GRAVTPHPRGGAPLPPPHSPPTPPPTSAHPLLRSRPDQRAGRARVCPPAGPSAGSRRDDNEGRPHMSLGYQTPAEFAARCRASSPTAHSEDESDRVSNWTLLTKRSPYYGG